jgi:hypothetical protein
MDNGVCSFEVIYRPHGYTEGLSGDPNAPWVLECTTHHCTEGVYVYRPSGIGKVCHKAGIEVPAEVFFADDAPFVPTPVDIEAWNAYAEQASTDQALADFAACVESPARVLLIVPSETDLPADLYFGDVDYHEGWVFDTETEARAFAEKAVAEHPGVVVDFEIKPVEVAG